MALFEEALWRRVKDTPALRAAIGEDPDTASLLLRVHRAVETDTASRSAFESTPGLREAVLAMASTRQHDVGDWVLADLAGVPEAKDPIARRLMTRLNQDADAIAAHLRPEDEEGKAEREMLRRILSQQAKAE